MKKQNLFFFLLILITKTMFANLNLSIEPLSTNYDNGERLFFRIRATNDSELDIENLQLKMPLSVIKTSIEGGGDSFIFQDLRNISLNSSENSSFGTYDINSDFCTIGTKISAKGYVEFEISAVVKDKILGEINGITLKAEINNITQVEKILETPINRKGLPKIRLSKIGSKKDLEPLVSIYTITVENYGEILEKNIRIIDIISTIKPTSSIIYPDATTNKLAFTEWNIKVETTLNNPETSVGNFAPNQDLDTYSATRFVIKSYDMLTVA